MKERYLLIFESVCDPKDWKGPIDTVVDESEVVEVLKAIHYFTATDAEIFNLGNGRVRVTSIGYRQGPAGP